MKRVILLGLSLWSLSVMASDCATSMAMVEGLSPESKAALVTACEASQVKPKESMTILEKFTDPNQLSEISHIAKVAGQTVREVAYELNVASNDFIKSPVGILTAGLAIWYVTGDSIMSAIKNLWQIPIGFLLMFLSYYLTKKIFVGLLASEYEDVEQTGWFGKKYTIRRVKAYYKISDREIGEGACFAMFIAAGGGLVTFIIGVVLVAL